jgi:hypothetical protein
MPILVIIASQPDRPTDLSPTRTRRRQSTGCAKAFRHRINVLELSPFTGLGEQDDDRHCALNIAHLRPSTLDNWSARIAPPWSTGQSHESVNTMKDVLAWQHPFARIEDVETLFEHADYIADRPLCLTTKLAFDLTKPVLLEGEAGPPRRRSRCGQN